MNENGREKTIVDYMESNTFASVRDLGQILDASDATIRRDIAKLHEKGLVLKVFGGIAPVGETLSDRSAKPFAENKVRNVEQKRAISKLAATFCDDGDTIIVHGGTTAYMFAEEIVNKQLRVITNSMPVAAMLWERSKIHLIVAGGELHREPEILFGGGYDSNSNFASKFFIGAQAFGPEGIMESNPLLVEAVAQLMARSDEIIVLCDSSKFDIRARLVACPINRIGTVITDSGIADASREMLRSQGVRLIIAET